MMILKSICRKHENQSTTRKYDANIPEKFSWTDEMKDRMIKALSTHGLRFAFHQPGEVVCGLGSMQHAEWSISQFSMYMI